MAKKQTNATRAPHPVTEAAARASADLTELGVRFALVGGLAVSAWSEPQGKSCAGDCARSRWVGGPVQQLSAVIAQPPHATLSRFHTACTTKAAISPPSA